MLVATVPARLKELKIIAFSCCEGVMMFLKRLHLIDISTLQGWEGSASEDEMQFSWPRLGEDMLQVNLNLNLNPFPLQVVDNQKGKVAIGGSSMGAASAIFAALQAPQKVLLGLFQSFCIKDFLG